MTNSPHLWKSFGTVSYSSSIVTMTVSVAISEIFRVKEWPELEIWVMGCSTSLEIERFDRPCMTFLLIRHCNYSSILYHLRFIWRWKFRDLEIWLRGHSRSFKLAPFESLGAISYSPSIVTTAVSVAVCEIFSVKEWRDIENRVRVRSRSLEMAPFDRSHVIRVSVSVL